MAMTPGFARPLAPRSRATSARRTGRRTRKPRVSARPRRLVASVGPTKSVTGRSARARMIAKPRTHPHALFAEDLHLRHDDPDHLQILVRPGEDHAVDALHSRPGQPREHELLAPLDARRRPRIVRDARHRHL